MGSELIICPVRHLWRLSRLAPRPASPVRCLGVLVILSWLLQIPSLPWASLWPLTSVDLSRLLVRVYRRHAGRSLAGGRRGQAWLHRRAPSAAPVRQLQRLGTTPSSWAIKPRLGPDSGFAGPQRLKCPCRSSWSLPTPFVNSPLWNARLPAELCLCSVPEPQVMP